MIEPIEPRRLMSVTYRATGGKLLIRGDDASNDIRITATIGRRLVKPGKLAMAVESYTLTVDGVNRATIDAARITRINVYAGGGNDRVSGPGPLTTFVPDPNDNNISTTLAGDAVAGVHFARMDVQGGSGRDRITGGYGDDTLIGGRGDDDLKDLYGRNLLEGNAGDDTLTTAIGNVVSAPNHAYQVEYSGSGRNTLSGGAGEDTYFDQPSDTSLDEAENRPVFATGRAV